MISLIPFAICVALLRESFGKPTETLIGSETLDAFNSNTEDAIIGGSALPDTLRQQRSPQFGLVEEYGDYSFDDYSDYTETRHYKSGPKRKHHKLHHKPLGIIGVNGCRGYGCGGGGWQPDYGGNYGGYHETGGGGSFASASAGSVGGGGAPHEGHSQANAQSASFSLGPYTATFSVAQASAGRHHR